MIGGSNGGGDTCRRSAQSLRSGHIRQLGKIVCMYTCGWRERCIYTNTQPKNCIVCKTQRQPLRILEFLGS